MDEKVKVEYLLEYLRILLTLSKDGHRVDKNINEVRFSIEKVLLN
jgi:hypothetical protein